MNQMAALLDFHENVGGTRKLFHQASPTSLPSGHVITIKNAIVGISDLAGIYLFLMVPAVCQTHQAERGKRGRLCIAEVEPPFSWLPFFQRSLL